MDRGVALAYDWATLPEPRHTTPARPAPQSYDRGPGRACTGNTIHLSTADAETLRESLRSYAAAGSTGTSATPTTPPADPQSGHRLLVAVLRGDLPPAASRGRRPPQRHPALRLGGVSAPPAQGGAAVPSPPAATRPGPLPHLLTGGVELSGREGAAEGFAATHVPGGTAEPS